MSKFFTVLGLPEPCAKSMSTKLYRGLPDLIWKATASLAAAAMSLSFPSPSWAAEIAPLSVELNKLEPQAKACRAYLVVDNPTETAYTALKLDLFVFRTDGVIDRRLLIDLAPVRPGKKSVKLFDLDGLACETIGSLLVNGVTECRDAAGPVADCLSRLRFTSRASATLSK